MDRVLEGGWLRSSDVARRLGVSPGTVRHYGELLRSRGYPMQRREEDGLEEWLWSPELVELARVAYQVARSVRPRLSFEQAVELIEYAGRVAVQARKGETLPEQVARVLAAVEDLGAIPEDLAEAARGVSASVRSVRGELQRASEEVLAAAEALQDVAGAVRREVEASVPGGGWVVAALVLLSLALLLPWVFEAVGQGISAERVRFLGPVIAAFVLGGVLGWWVRRI